MTVVEQRITTQFARRAASGRGLNAAAAIAAAEARIGNMRDMQATRSAILAGDPAAAHVVHAQADSLVGLCGLFDLTEVGAAASSLCKLFDECLPGRPDARSIQVHVDALQMLWSLPVDARKPAAPSIIKGLLKIVGASKPNSLAD